jgi:hypothetical protein
VNVVEATGHAYKPSPQRNRDVLRNRLTGNYFKTTFIKKYQFWF